MKKNIKKYLYVCFYFIFLGSFLQAANNPNQVYQKSNEVFDEILSGLNSGSVSAFSKYLSNQTFLSLSTGESGYFSSSQLYNILDNFFNVHRPINFKFAIRRSDNNPYGFGTLTYENKGRKETAQVYISLRQQGDNYIIAQLTIK